MTAPTSVSVDGTLWVQVTTNAWMNELSLMEPQTVASAQRARGPDANPANSVAVEADLTIPRKLLAGSVLV